MTQKQHKEATILIMVDACRKDYIEYTEFIKKLTNCNLLNLESTFGFKSTTGGWSAGLYPESSDLYSIFAYSPATSPFKIFRNPVFRRSFTIFDNLLHILLKNFRNDRLLYHSPAFLLRYLTSTLMKKIYSNPEITLSEVPYDYLPYFDISEKKSPTENGYIDKPTIFNILNEHNKKWLYIGGQNSLVLRNKNKVNYVKRIIMEKYYDFIFLHISDLDAIGHLYGPNSTEIREVTQILDNFIQELYRILINKYKNLNLILFSDHGMVEVSKTVNIWEKIENLPLEFGKDYVMFLDSPSARFWFMNEKAEKLIENVLSEIHDGKILTEKEYKDYKIRFKHNKYWDLIFLVNPGVLVFPNFFQREFPVKGMHGYQPSYKDNMGVFLAHLSGERKIKKVDTVHMVDIFPTVLNIMDLPIPPTSEGRSLLEK